MRVRIERQPANTMLRVRMDGPISRYSEIALAPNSPTLFPLDYKDLPPGVYDIAADLVRHDGHTWVAGRAAAHLQVGTDDGE